MSPRRRLLWAVLGGGLLGLLATARFLPPDPRGFGTHERLDLPPCSFHWLFGRRCPSCGITTAWAHAVRGQWPDAVRANACGAALAPLAAMAAVLLIASAARGRWIGPRPGDRQAALAVLAAVALLLAEWAWRTIEP